MFFHEKVINFYLLIRVNIVNNTKDWSYEKLDYIRNNPVEEMIVPKPEYYIVSSARNYEEWITYLSLFNFKGMENLQLGKFGFTLRKSTTIVRK